MGSNNKIYLILSIVIVSLVIIPLVILFGLTNLDLFELEDNFNVLITSFDFLAFYANIINIISLLLHISYSILLVIGIKINNSNCIKVGFGLGIPSWILNFIIVDFVINAIWQFEFNEIRGFIGLLSWAMMIFIWTGGYFPYFLIPFFQFYHMIPLWFKIIIRINFISTILCIVFGVIILYRSKKL